MSLIKQQERKLTFYKIAKKASSALCWITGYLIMLLSYMIMPKTMFTELIVFGIGVVLLYFNIFLTGVLNNLWDEIIDEQDAKVVRYIERHIRLGGKI